VRASCQGHDVVRFHQCVGALPDDALEGAIEFVNAVGFRPKRRHAKLLGGGLDLAPSAKKRILAICREDLRGGHIAPQCHPAAARSARAATPASALPR
jgi:hypothetical protein